MKHPNREQWVGFLYEDCDPAEKAELSEHLKTCASCREQLDTWRTTTTALNAYKVDRRAQPNWHVTPWLRWSAAATIFLAVGITIGSMWTARANSTNPQLITELRNRVEKSEAESARTQRLLAELTQTIAENRAKDQAALLTTAQQVQATRKDLETVAALTQSHFVRLASYTSPVE